MLLKPILHLQNGSSHLFRPRSPAVFGDDSQPNSLPPTAPRVRRTLSASVRCPSQASGSSSSCQTWRKAALSRQTKNFQRLYRDWVRDCVSSVSGGDRDAEQVECILPPDRAMGMRSMGCRAAKSRAKPPNMRAGRSLFHTQTLANPWDWHIDTSVGVVEINPGVLVLQRLTTSGPSRVSSTPKKRPTNQGGQTS